VKSLLQAGHPLASPQRQLALLESTRVPDFDEMLARHDLSPLDTEEAIEVLQINVGKLCNQTCAHCHVDAGPDRKEVMTRETAERVIDLLRAHPIPTLDITGGAPELNSNFRWLVEQARELGRHVIDRCNLTVLLINNQRDLVDFLAAHEVEVIASLPSFRPSGTSGNAARASSTRALRRCGA